MAIESRGLILLFLLLAAVLSYAVGFIAGAPFFVAIGIIFELSFWVKAIKNRYKGR